jgi:Na+/proline symporter
MGLTVVLGGVWYPLSNLLLAQGRQASYTGCYLFLALASLPVAHGLAGPLAATGGAIAMVAVDAAMLVVVLRAVRRHLASRPELAEAARGWKRRLASAFARHFAGRQALP